MQQVPVSVSVIIPCYNGETYLAETIQSVLNQTRPASEIFIIDDGSTDRTSAIAHSFEPAVKVITRTNSGVCNSRNYAASLATSDWLAFLDHDDPWEPENLARLTAEITRNPQADCCYAGRNFLIQKDAGSGFAKIPAPPMPQPHELPKVFMDRCPMTPCSVLIKRETFVALGGFDHNHHGAEDWDMWLRLSFHGARFVSCPEPLTNYRIHAASLSQKAMSWHIAVIGVIRQNILPRMTPFQRATRGRRLISRIESETAILMREHQNSDALNMMLRSILRHPFHAPRRYKIAAHMLGHPKSLSRQSI
jgi:glycosyltransferase involved in cell wall biosynthesis